MSTEKQRRAAAHRKLERQIERRQEAERQRKQQMIILSLIASIVVIGLVTWMAIANSGDEETKATGCGFVSDGMDSTFGTPSDKDLQTSGTVDLQMVTNRGDFTIELDRSSAPCAVESFVHLAQQQYFDDTICHRLTTGSLAVLQCGDPTGTGTGGPGYRFAEEPPTGPNPYPEGTVAMANCGQPSSTGSQFFICYGSCANLPPNYSVVGQVTEGLDVVQAIGAEGTDNGTGDGAPANEVRITSATIAE